MSGFYNRVSRISSIAVCKVSAICTQSTRLKTCMTPASRPQENLPMRAIFGVARRMPALTLTDCEKRFCVRAVHLLLLTRRPYHRFSCCDTNHGMRTTNQSHCAHSRRPIRHKVCRCRTKNDQEWYCKFAARDRGSTFFLTVSHDR